MKISVCVPSYERPRMIAELVGSFAVQDYPEKELCISDDSQSEAVSDVISRFPDLNIVYVHNKENLGYCRNFYAALSMASGDVMITLGDDDMLATPTALSQYVEAFEKNPNALFAYGNLIQFDENHRITLMYKFFDKTRNFETGEDAVRNLMLRSILITGIGLRKSPLIEKYYPNAVQLFPQVELVGRLLVEGDGVGIASFLCATRSHSEQLGFKAIKGEAIKGTELHGNIEVSNVIRGLIEDYPSLVAARKQIEKNLVLSFTTNIANEKVNTSSSLMLRNVYSLLRRTQFSFYSVFMVCVALVVAILPSSFALTTKNKIRLVVERRQAKAYGIVSLEEMMNL